PGDDEDPAHSDDARRHAQDVAGHRQREHLAGLRGEPGAEALLGTERRLDGDDERRPAPPRGHAAAPRGSMPTAPRVTRASRVAPSTSGISVSVSTGRNPRAVIAGARWASRSSTTIAWMQSLWRPATPAALTSTPAARSSSAAGPLTARPATMGVT